MSVSAPVRARLAVGGLVAGTALAVLLPPPGPLWAMRMLVSTRGGPLLQRLWVGVYALAWVGTLLIVLMIGPQ